MNIDQRLHHAARELRAIEVSVPPLRASTTTRQRLRVPALAAGVALVVTLAAASVGLMTTSGNSPEQLAELDPMGTRAVDSPDPASALVDVVLDPREEIAIIERLSATSSTEQSDLRRPVRRGVI